MSDESVYVNGLAVTPTRLAVVRLIDKRAGAVHYNPATKVAHNAISGRRITADLKLLAANAWIRPATDEERTEVEKKHPEWHYYRLTEYGQVAMERGRR